MKRAFSLLLMTSAVAAAAAFPAVPAFAAQSRAASAGITQQQIRADLYRSFLTGTTANDEKNTYPSPPSNRADLQSLRCSDARAHLSRSEFPAIVKAVCTG